MSTPSTHPLLRGAVVVAVIAAFALVGCKKKEENAEAPPASATAAMPAPSTMPPASATAGMPPASTTAAMGTAPTTMTVTSVDLGNAIGADNKITMPMTSFAKKDTIHASVATDGPGGNLTAKWTMGDKVVSSQDKTIPAGPQVTEFSISKPDGWPSGHYKLEIMMAGNAVQAKEFDVK